MKQKNKKLTSEDVKTLFEINLKPICAIARESGSAEQFKDGVYRYLMQNEEMASSPAGKNILCLLEFDGRKIHEMSTGEDIEMETLTSLWNYLTGRCSEECLSQGFLHDIYRQLMRLNTTDGEKPLKETVRKWMGRWPSGLDESIRRARRDSKERIIGWLVGRIDKHHAASNRYFFEEGITETEKYDRVKAWWFDYRFQLVMAARSIREINKALGHTLSEETIAIYNEARKKGIPVFVTPYYLSLLATNAADYDDAAIRSYVLYSRELVETFGHIRAWEKEDIVEPGKPNAAGWLLPEGHNIHRRYPDVAIFIPDSMGRACGGLCASCQRMYDFQSKRLNFNFDKLKPNETWNHKLRRLMEYFENDSQICDILITGGDALMSQNKTLRNILRAVLKMVKNKRAANTRRADGEKYAEIKRVRLGTRLPVYLPMRINDELLEILADFKIAAEKEGVGQFYIQTHFQSPLELTPESREALRRIQSTGWIVTNQLVFNVAASRRGHTAKLRKVLNEYGVICYYTFSVKGFHENHAVFVPNSRSMQECMEEKAVGKVGEEVEAAFFDKYYRSRFKSAELRRFCEENSIPFLATDRNVLNLPGIGKSMSFRLAGIMPDGTRVLEFDHDRTRRHSPVIEHKEKIFIRENKSIHEYLLQLEEMGENSNEYASIWEYTSGSTERRFGLYQYPEQAFRVTGKYTNIGVM
jgi:lysine 2,3-aminomutase